MGLGKNTYRFIAISNQAHDDMVLHVQVGVPARIMRGPWGGNGGTHKEMEGKSLFLKSLTIYHHGVVEGFQFSYTDEDSQIRTAGPWGQNRNLFIHEVSRFHTLPCMCMRLFCNSCWLMPAFIIEKTMQFYVWLKSN